MKHCPTSILAAAAVLSTIGCSNAYAATAIKIGVLTPLTGTYADIGQQVKWGIDLATKQINASGGIMGRPIKLIYEDSEANATVAVRKADKLFQVDKVDFLTGTVNSGGTVAVGQIAERADKLIATSVSTASSVTGSKCSPDVFRFNANSTQQAIVLAAWLAKAKPKARIFYIGPDYLMGRSAVSAMKQATEKVGAVELGEVFAPLGAKDYSQYFGQIREARPNVLYDATAGNDTVRLLTQLQDFGLLKHLTVMGTPGTVTSGNLGAIGSAAEGYVTGIGYSPEINTPANKAFLAAFETAYKAEPDVYGANSYGLIYAYKAAVEKAKSTDTDKVRKALRGLTSAWPQGEKTVRPGDNQTIQAMYVVRVTNGKFKIIDKVKASVAAGPDTCTRF